MIEIISYIALIVGALAFGYALLSIIFSVERETERTVGKGRISGSGNV
ncbi:MAG: hypothetical protein GXO18_05275 [Aquificae bacterium]|nr:hypothetical protein [Aquificota bacterium]